MVKNLVGLVQRVAEDDFLDPVLGFGVTGSQVKNTLDRPVIGPGPGHPDVLHRDTFTGEGLGDDPAHPPVIF